jgi:hypothetical protein
MKYLSLYFRICNNAKTRILTGYKEKHHLFGKPCSEERKKKISKANKGKLVGDKNPAKSIEVRKKISEKWNYRNFQYTFITPWGNYNRAPIAAKEAPFKVSSRSILNWCNGIHKKEGFSIIKHY